MPISQIDSSGLATGAVAQVDLAAGVAGTGPAFSAYMGSVQSISNTTATKLQFNTKEYDTSGNYDNVTNYRFTPSVSGYYTIKASVQIAFASTGTAILYIYKNGSAVKSTGSSVAGTNSPGVITADIYLNGSTDYVEMYAWQASGGSVNFNSGSQWTWFQAALVRAA